MRLKKRVTVWPIPAGPVKNVLTAISPSKRSPSGGYATEKEDEEHTFQSKSIRLGGDRNMNSAVHFCHCFVIKAPRNDVRMKLKSTQRSPDQTTSRTSLVAGPFLPTPIFIHSSGVNRKTEASTSH